MQGTPFIYQGQEIGMTNVQFESIDDYDDVSAKNMYHIKSAAGIPHTEIMEILWASGRDNARTPMQWTGEEGAGFTTGSPWLKINPNYKEINVEAQKLDSSSIFNFYKKMIKLKKVNKIFTYGIYDLLCEEDPQIYAYTRTHEGEKIIIMANLSDQPAEMVVEGFLDYNQLLLNNYVVSKHEPVQELTLQPYETRVYRL
jgi:alpha-glucosidase